MQMTTLEKPIRTAREFFSENGYYLAKGVYSPDEVAGLEIDFDRIVAQLQGSGEEINANWKGKTMQDLGAAERVILHTHHVENYSARFHRAFLQERFLGLASEILGPDVILHHSKLFQKPPEKGSPFPMHQDWLYFPTVKDTMIAGVIHVSEATDEMGCFRIYPGTHKLGRLQRTMGQEEDGGNDLLKNYPLDQAMVVEAEPGDVLFFHYFLLHGSMPNRSPKTRKTVLVQMYRGDDQVEEGNQHMDSKLVLQGWNHKASRNKAGKRA